ncbi:MAG: phosphate/phosphite/phosphonate ABC transporter substrate-binding protein [Candidatus Tectomicrobia bacterium]|nr:phosphate/phosphite/phosphonate ABC transporter substrate-binding protein [Candidatus Tectomicrobia bacterium]
MISLSKWLAFIGLFLLSFLFIPGESRAEKKALVLGVGLFQPNPELNQKTYKPLADFLAKELGVEIKLITVDTWVGFGNAFRSGQLDMGLLGPWGYVISHQVSGCQAIATIEYDGKPSYQAIIVTNQKEINSIQDARGKTFAFGDVGSTSGYLIPYYYMTNVLKIQPEEFFGRVVHLKHQTIEQQVANGLLDLGADYNRNRNAMIEAGLIKPEESRIIWTSDDLPNDPFAVSAELFQEKAFVGKLQKALLKVKDQLKVNSDLLPLHYTGFQLCDDSCYRFIREAGIVTGKLKTN